MFEQDIEIVAMLTTTILSVLGLVVKVKYNKVKALINEVNDALDDDKISVGELKLIITHLKGMMA